MRSRDEDIRKFLNIGAPNLTTEQIIIHFQRYKLPIPSWLNDQNIQISNGMTKVIENLNTFSCSYKNLLREVRIHFSNNMHYFLYHCLLVIFKVTFRLQLIIDLIKELIPNDQLFHCLFYSLILFKSEYRTIGLTQFSMFIEFLYIENFINDSEYSIILDLMNWPCISKNCREYIFTQKTYRKSIAEWNYQKTIDAIYEENQINYLEQSQNKIEIDEIQIRLSKVKDQMVNLKSGDKLNRYLNDTKKISLLLYNSSKVSYSILRQIFCLPCEKTVEDFNEPFEKIIKTSLFNLKNVKDLLEIQDIHFDKVIDVNLAVDAATFESLRGNEIIKHFDFLKGVISENKFYNSIFTFYVEPIEPHLKSFPVHVYIKEDGFADDTIGFIQSYLVSKLKDFNINCLFTSSDGDHFYDNFHNAVFDEYKTVLENGGTFQSIIEKVKELFSNGPWPLSDPLHLLKTIRTKTLFRNVGLSILEEFKIQELYNFLQNEKCISDSSSQGSMKDSYPLTLFNFESFINSRPFLQPHFFITPFFLFSEAIRNSRLNLNTRKIYLETSFYFINYFLHQNNFIRCVSTRITLIRFLNTILGIYICTDKRSFNMANLGSHPLECFFGTVRIGCKYKHTLFNVIHTISKTIINNNIISDLGLIRKIKGRQNVGGAIVEDKDDNYGFFPCSPIDFFNIYLKKLYYLNVDDSENSIICSFYDYLIKHHSKNDDCEVYIQGQFSGCNILSRNILATKKNHATVITNKNAAKNKSFLKNITLKHYSNQMVIDLKNHMMKAITEFKSNPLLLVNKVFGFVLEKYKYIPNGDDLNWFILTSVFKKNEKLNYTSSNNKTKQTTDLKIYNSSDGKQKSMIKSTPVLISQFNNCIPVPTGNQQQMANQFNYYIPVPTGNQQQMTNQFNYCIPVPTGNQLEKHLTGFL